MKKNFIVIAIAGVTCGGKSCVADRILTEYSNVIRINTDDFFREKMDPNHVWIELSNKIKHQNWEILESYDWLKFDSYLINLYNDKILDQSKNKILLENDDNKDCFVNGNNSTTSDKEIKINGSEVNGKEIDKIKNSEVNGEEIDKINSNKKVSFEKDAKKLKVDHCIDNEKILVKTSCDKKNSKDEKLKFVKKRTKLILFEGNVVLCHQYPDIVKFDKKIFITLNENTCRERRFARVYDPEDPPLYFEECVWPSYLKHLECSKSNYSDIIFIDGSLDKETVFSKINEEIENSLLSLNL